ncbi:MAG: FAD-binding protein [Clostridiales bacterium]|nr:FAD-binding protein [Clostridiales bacterium]
MTEKIISPEVLKNARKEYHDVIIIGSGIAGVYTALIIPDELQIVILTKETIDISNSALAQGGIAVSLDKEDSPLLHFKDTINAGAGLCDEETVWVLVNDAARNIEQLMGYGVNFDKSSGDTLMFGREAAHSKSRIIHAGDTTGKEVCDKLILTVRTKSNVIIKERNFVIDLLTENVTQGVTENLTENMTENLNVSVTENVNESLTESDYSGFNKTLDMEDSCNTNERCIGVMVFDEDSDEIVIHFASVVICATGGFGKIFASTTNPEVATGDGACIAYRAGAELCDLEFIQFHPTVLHHPDNSNFLISEAVRGEEAILRNSAGERFMPAYHPMAELAPRDVVSRAIFEEMKKTGASNVFLDITFKNREYLENRFPNIFRTCLGYAIDMSKDMIPVAPAEHYCMGGIKCDAYGRTAIKGFYACGEAACNGIHGANRLASNSLLEGLVFGKRIGDEVAEVLAGFNRHSGHTNHESFKGSSVHPDHGCSINQTDQIEHEGLINQTDLVLSDGELFVIRDEVRRVMTDKVGIIRSGEGLLEAKEKIRELKMKVEGMKNTRPLHFEIQNILTLSALVIDSALTRQESRGAHFRSDFPKIDDENWHRHICVKNH